METPTFSHTKQNFSLWLDCILIVILIDDKIIFNCASYFNTDNSKSKNLRSLYDYCNEVDNLTLPP